MPIESTIYKIQSTRLRPYVEYILFNQAAQVQQSQIVTSLPNTNICLGILKGHELVQEGKQQKLKAYPSISAYLSALYTKPHHFLLEGAFDEICIDFTLAGYHHFFKTPLSTYVLGEPILTENFGKPVIPFFEAIFELQDLNLRGQLIEQWLLSLLDIQAKMTNGFLEQLTQIKQVKTVENLGQQLFCSERKLQRIFSSLLDCSPKNFLRIRRFRRLLQQLNSLNSHNIQWEQLAYHFEYYDYSHLVKEFKAFTGQNPKQFLKHKIAIENTVTVCVQTM